MRVLGIDHVAIATESLDDHAAFWQEILGIDLRGTQVVASEGVVTNIYDTGKGRVELLAEHGEDSPIKKFLEKRGPGIHHICLEVQDIVSAIDELKGKGIRLVSEEPTTGAEGYAVIFIHPESTGGVLVELCQKT